MSISIFIFAAIILFTLGIAFYAGRQSNKQSVGDYLVGGRSFSVMFIVVLIYDYFLKANIDIDIEDDVNFL